MTDNSISSNNNDEPVPQDNVSIQSDICRELNVKPGMEGFDITEMLDWFIQHANVADAFSRVEPKLEYVVQIPIKYREAFESGKAFLNENTKTGVTWPALYERLENGKRQIICNLPIKQKEIIQGNPFEKATISYHNLCLQQKIDRIADTMLKTCQIAERIEQGVQDNRIGLLKAGRDQILYSFTAKPEERIIQFAQGQSNMIVAQEQLCENLKSRVRGFAPIPKSKLKQFGMEYQHSGTLRSKDREFSEIQVCYALYFQATLMIAASYAICGNMDAAKKVFDDAISEMKKIDFENMQTLRYIHKNTHNSFCYHAVDYIAYERDDFLNDTQHYDAICINISGKELLEVIKNAG